jgi:hypothetical protein
MDGPFPKGNWGDPKAPNCSRQHDFLCSGNWYTVTREFQDYDGHVHPVGERWMFIGKSFLPYEDGLTLCVSLDGKDEWIIRMQWRPEEQGNIIENLADYIASTTNN